MRLSPLAKEILLNMLSSSVPSHVDDLLAQSTITKHSRRLNAAVLDLENRKVIYLVMNPNSITQYGCEYGVRGIHNG